MRGERRGFLLDRGRFGRGRRGGLVPLDRLRLARHRAGEHLVHARDRNDLEPFLDALADLHEVLGVRFGNEHCLDAPAQGREQLLLETGDRPHTAAQRNFAAWMAMYCLNLMRIALELAQHNHVYEDIATKFFEHFLHIAEAMTHIGEGMSLWNEEDGFY